MQNLDTAIQNLTPVLAGMPLVDVHTATRVNAVQDSLKDINNTFKERKRLPSDPIIPRGSSDNPYVLGSCVWGSSENTSNPGGTRGYWGGFRDKNQNPNGPTAATDTWHRDRQPNSFGSTDKDDKPCDGVTLILTRTYISYYNNTEQTTEFQRTALYDSVGALVSVSEETGGDSSSSSSSSSSSGGSSAGPSGSSGSDKSTAIVPAEWSPTGYVALFTDESPEVVFHDTLKVQMSPFGSRVTRVKIDRRFLSVCEPGNVWVSGYSCDSVHGMSTQVVAGEVVIRRGWLNCATDVIVTLTGIRKGFLGRRFPNRTREQFVANEEFINSAYPAS